MSISDERPAVEPFRHRRAAEQIQRFGEEVVPPIHEKHPAVEHPAIPEACWW